MPNLRFTVNRRALLSYNELTSRERRALSAALVPLSKLPEQQWPTAGAVRLESADPLYLVRVDDSLRAIIRPTSGAQPELLDLVRQETLQRYFQDVE
jgi:hypothetical protein